MSTSVPGDIQYQAAHSAGFFAQLTLQSIVFVVSFVAFCIAKNAWANIYQPRRNLKKGKPPVLKKNWLSWITDVYRVDEDFILENCGLDAVVFLRFIKFGVLFFAFATFWGVIVIIPIHISASSDIPPERLQSPPSLLSIDNVPDGSPFLTTHAVFTWIFSVTIFYLLHRTLKSAIDLRYRFFLENYRGIHTRSVMVTDIPDEFKSENLLKAFFNEMGIGPVEEAVLVRHVKALGKMVTNRAQKLKECEDLAVSIMGNPPRCERVEDIMNMTENNLSMPSAMPSLENVQDNQIVNGNHLMETEVRSTKAHGIKERIQSWNSWRKLSTDNKLAYSWRRFRSYDDLVQRYRHENLVGSKTSTAFVVFRDHSSAAIASQILISSKPTLLHTVYAPEPRDVLWSHTALSPTQLKLRRLVAVALLVVLVFFWAIPVAFFASFLSLDKLAKALPFLEDVLEWSPFVRGMIEGVLPTLAVTIFFSILPILLDVISNLQGYKSYSETSLSSLNKHFYFLLFNVLLVFTVAGTIFQSVSAIIKSPTEIVDILASSLPQVGPFFVNYMILHSLGVLPLSFLRLGEIIVINFKRRILCRTPRYYADIMTPPDLQFSRIAPIVVLLFVIGLTYSNITPLILPFTLLYFIMSYFYHKYCFLYVFVQKYETTGWILIMAIRYILVGTFIFQLLMIGILSLKLAFAQSISIIPLLFLTGIVALYFHRTYDKRAWNVPADIFKDLNQVDNLVLEQKRGQRKVYGDEETGVGSCSRMQTMDIEMGSEESVGSDDYVGEYDPLTDFKEPQLQLGGVLSTRMASYQHPYLVGRLPQLWLPSARR
ncbi:hypothetical protein BKA69DRAFT_1045074 [Paraphysoderma sedebokerense]|nr:hypothetical protein BKA69DRAFT_1045074 [Paraphysoderma sedebokerense]